ncbi:MAG: class I SAM-dependent methyltransferase [bacterium]|nr:class I SAM-dependent methyltransferase [bacterium]
MNFNKKEYKLSQEKSWDSLSEYWIKWDNLFETCIYEVTEWILKSICFKPDITVLDVATGMGRPALSIAEKISPSGQVTGVDISRNMIEAAKIKCMGLQNIELIQADAEEFFFTNTKFDYIVSRFGLSFLPNIHNTLSNFAQMLKPAGCFCATLWHSATESPFISLAFDVTNNILKLPPPPPVSPNPFSLSDPIFLKQLAKESGFNYTEVIDLSINSKIETLELFMNYSWDILPPFLKKEVSKVSSKSDVLKHLEKKLSAFRQSDNSLSIESKVICIRCSL